MDTAGGARLAGVREPSMGLLERAKSHVLGVEVNGDRQGCLLVDNCGGTNIREQRPGSFSVFAAIRPYS